VQRIVHVSGRWIDCMCVERNVAWEWLRCAWLPQNPQERSQAEQALKVFGLSPDYITHCKVLYGG